MSDLYIHVCITVSHILKRANFISKCHNRPRVSFFIQKCYKMHFGVRLHGQNACYVIFWNIAPKHWIYILLLFMTLYLLGICYWMCFCSRRAYHIENMVDIKNLKHFIMRQFVDFKYRIWWYHAWIFSILHIFPGKFW